MSFNDFMNKIRYYDNMVARWIMRHFYFVFFQIVLVVIFVFWFINTFRSIDISHYASQASLQEQALAVQSLNTTLIVILMILNSFWILFIFNILQRLMLLLKDINYSLGRLRARNKKN